ncbi:unnamed protein product [Urochloa humidicola]
MAEKSCLKRLQKEYHALCKEPPPQIVARRCPTTYWSGAAISVFIVTVSAVKCLGGWLLMSHMVHVAVAITFLFEFLDVSIYMQLLNSSALCLWFLSSSA